MQYGAYAFWFILIGSAVYALWQALRALRGEGIISEAATRTLLSGYEERLTTRENALLAAQIEASRTPVTSPTESLRPPGPGETPVNPWLRRGDSPVRPIPQLEPGNWYDTLVLESTGLYSVFGF